MSSVMDTSRPMNSTRGGKTPTLTSLPKPRRRSPPSKRPKARPRADRLREIEAVRKPQQASGRRVRRRARQSNMRHWRSSATLPDLQAIFDTFAEALAITQAAHMAAKQADHWGPPEVALGKGIDMLKRVYSDLDGATTDLARFKIKQLKAVPAVPVRRRARRRRP